MNCLCATFFNGNHGSSFLRTVVDGASLFSENDELDRLTVSIKKDIDLLKRETQMLQNERKSDSKTYRNGQTKHQSEMILETVTFRLQEITKSFSASLSNRTEVRNKRKKKRRFQTERDLVFDDSLQKVKQQQELGEKLGVNPITPILRQRKAPVQFVASPNTKVMDNPNVNETNGDRFSHQNSTHNNQNVNVVEEEKSESIFIPIQQQRMYSRKDRLTAVQKIESTISELQKGKTRFVAFLQ